jgi:hypothetical protein
MLPHERNQLLDRKGHCEMSHHIVVRRKSQVLGLTREQHDRDPSKPRVAREHGEELAAGHDRSGGFQEDEPRRLVHGREPLERGFAVRGIDHPEPFGSENASQKRGELLVLIDDENQRASIAHAQATGLLRADAR